MDASVSLSLTLSSMAKLTHSHRTVASTFGTCVGLFFLAGFYRFLFAVRTVAELRWISQDTCDSGRLSPSSKQEGPVTRFAFKIDLLRGLLEGFQSFIGYFLMLVVR